MEDEKREDSVIIETVGASRSSSNGCEKWSPEERWAWEKIRSGEKADFNAMLGEADPKEAKHWDAKRTLTVSFLRQILFEKPYRDEIPFEGVRIIGAYLPEKMVLAHGRLDRQLWLDLCRFEQGVDLTGLRADDTLSLEGSFIAEQSSAAVSVNLLGAKIYALNLAGVTVAGKLGMNGLQVERALSMCSSTMERPASFREVDLTGAEIGDQLNLQGAIVEGILGMNGLRVAKNLDMCSTAERSASFQEVNLTEAKVGGLLNLAGSTVDGKLTMNSLQVGEHLLMGSTAGRPASFNEVDLTAAKINGQLRLESA
ncbi:MAG: hypothetical protein WCB34_00055, partial [Methylovirgula sp.]